MKKRKLLTPGDEVVWFGYGKTKAGDAVSMQPLANSRDWAFEVESISGDDLILKDRYNGITIHRNQVLKVYRKKQKVIKYFLERRCSYIEHYQKFEASREELLVAPKLCSLAVCPYCTFRGLVELV